MTNAVRNLELIIILDSISYGMIYSFISPYILSLGANHVDIGILSIGNCVGDLLSCDVIKIFTHLNGKRYSLFFVLNTSLVTHLMLVLTDSYYFTILVRILFSITNQSQNLCLDLLVNKARSDEERDRFQTNYSILSAIGYVVGPIISGYLFDIGFGYTGILAATFALINTCLLMNVGKDEKDANPEHADQSVLEKAIDTVAQRTQDLKKCQYNKHWDMLLVKYLFSCSIMIFFAKFTQILKYNYHSSSIILGYTSAYINILVFATTYFTSKLRTMTQHYPEVFLSEVSFFALTVLLLFACYAPHYEIFMFLLVPIIILRTFTMDLWKGLFAERKDDNLIKLNQSASVVASLTTPILFGLVCNRIGKDAVVLFTCVSMFVSWTVTRFYSRVLEIDNTDIADTDKDK